MSFSDNLPLDIHIIFSNSVDIFEIVHKTCYILIWVPFEQCIYIYHSMLVGLPELLAENDPSCPSTLKYLCDICHAGCYQFIDSEKSGHEGFITSSNFPNFYPNNMDCEYVIQADPIHRIVLFVETFQLEPSPNYNCKNDYLKVSTGCHQWLTTPEIKGFPSLPLSAPVPQSRTN